MSWLWKQLKKWGLALAGLAALVTGLAWWQRRKADELGRVKDKLAVAAAQQNIADLRVVREQLTKQLDENDEAVQAIDQRLAANKRKIIEAHELGEGMDDEQIAEAFERYLR